LKSDDSSFLNSLAKLLNVSLLFLSFCFLGGGHIFSKKALKKLVEDSLLKDNPRCNLHESEFDDLITGKISQQLTKTISQNSFLLKENVLAKVQFL
jgi:hypothetical protein